MTHIKKTGEGGKLPREMLKQGKKSNKVQTWKKRTQKWEVNWDWSAVPLRTVHYTFLSGRQMPLGILGVLGVDWVKVRFKWIKEITRIDWVKQTNKQTLKTSPGSTCKYFRDERIDLATEDTDEGKGRKHGNHRGRREKGRREIHI